MHTPNAPAFARLPDMTPRSLARDARNLGPRLYTNTRPDYLFKIAGDNVKLEGFRLQGPDFDPSDGEARAIVINSRKGVEISKMEFSGWSLVAVYIKDPDFRIHSAVPDQNPRQSRCGQNPRQLLPSQPAQTGRKRLRHRSERRRSGHHRAQRFRFQPARDRGRERAGHRLRSPTEPRARGRRSALHQQHRGPRCAATRINSMCTAPTTAFLSASWMTNGTAAAPAKSSISPPTRFSTRKTTPSTCAAIRA